MTDGKNHTDHITPALAEVTNVTVLCSERTCGLCRDVAVMW